MLRLAQPADFSDVYEIYMHPEVLPYLGYDEMDKNEFLNIYQSLLDSESFFVWEESEKIRGFCRVTRHTGRSQHAAYLGTFAIDPDARGAGLAIQILNRIIQDWNQKGVLRFELTVLEDNLRAIAFYKKYGFQVEGMVRSSFKRLHQAQYINELSMAMLLL